MPSDRKGIAADNNDDVHGKDGEEDTEGGSEKVDMIVVLLLWSVLRLVVQPRRGTSSAYRNSTAVSHKRIAPLLSSSSFIVRPQDDDDEEDGEDRNCCFFRNCSGISTTEVVLHELRGTNTPNRVPL